MNLTDGEIHQLSQKDPENDYRKIKFEKHRLMFNAEGFGFQNSNENTFSRGDRELSASAMSNVVDSLKKFRGSLDETFINNLSKDIQLLATIDYKDTILKRTPVIQKTEPDLSVKSVPPPIVLSRYDSLNNLKRLIAAKEMSIRT
ncbi:MAG: hypothetical protein IPM96_13455 [Ignavibacteria bacterium]|nr:hypothetical protein [Ignavibacteria bacterium]